MINIRPNSKDAYKLLHEGALAFARAERVGLHVDVDYCIRKKEFLTKKIKYIQDKLDETKFIKHWKHCFGSKFNMGSNPQLSKFLYTIKKIKPVRFTATYFESGGEKGGGATDDRALLDLNIPELNSIIEIRKLKKIRDTYLEAFIREQVGGYMHPFFNLHLVRTYRSSSDHPNFQNIPKRDEEAMRICRRAIIPRPGFQLVEIDYSGIEVRISACCHKDHTMIDYINDPKSDMHLDMAKQIFMLDRLKKGSPGYVLRNAAKNGWVFPQFYGDYYKNCANYLACEWGKLPQSRWHEGQGIKISDDLFLSDHLINNGIKSFEAFVNHLEKIEDHFWGTRFGEYKKWKDKIWEWYQEHGYIDMFTGFRCSGVMSKNDVTNYPVQGPAFHCLLKSFIDVDRIAQKEGWKSQLIGQIHDAMVVDTHPSELKHVVETVREISCKQVPNEWEWIIVPLDVDTEVCDIDAPWSEKHSFQLFS